jgi:uncharacterized protein (TIGR03118 family)
VTNQQPTEEVIVDRNIEQKPARKRTSIFRSGTVMLALVAAACGGGYGGGYGSPSTSYGGQGETPGADAGGTYGPPADGGATEASLPVRRTDLVTDQPGTGAQLDGNLVNPWGLAFSKTGIAWVSDNHAGVATIYNARGEVQPLVVTIPAPTAGATSSPTGQVFNDSETAFEGDKFILATEDGTIVGWQSGSSAVIRADNSKAGAAYKGLALVTGSAGSLLCAANFAAGVVDLFDREYQPLAMPGAFTDPQLPAGFAPFNVKAIGGAVYVTYAKQDGDKRDDEAGPGIGQVDVFDPSGKLLKRLVSRALNSPWGLTLAPASFGPLSGTLLVGNFGDGTINAFDATGQLRGRLVDASNQPLVIPGLWALELGTGAGVEAQLFFTAGTDGETHGVFGRIDLDPRALR